MSCLATQTHLVVALVALSLCGVGPTEGISSSQPNPSLAYTQFIREAVLRARSDVLPGGADSSPVSSRTVESSCGNGNRSPTSRRPEGYGSDAFAFPPFPKHALRLKGGDPRRREARGQGYRGPWEYGPGAETGPDVYGGGHAAGGATSWMQAILASEPAAHRVAAVLSGCFFYSHESFVAAVSTLAFLIGNAGRDPSDLAWRRVRRSNAELWQRLGEDGFRVLQACGYRQAFNSNELLYTLDTVDTRALSSAEKVLLAARDYGLHWLRAELESAQRHAAQRRRDREHAAPEREHVASDADSEGLEDLTDRMWRACRATHAALTAPADAARALVSCLVRDLGMRTVREYSQGRGRGSGGDRWAALLAVAADGRRASPWPQLEVRQSAARAREGSKEGEDWEEQNPSSLDGHDHVLIESSEALQLLEERGFEADALGEVALRGPGGCSVRISGGRRGGGVWVVLSVSDIKQSMSFWGGVLGMREVASFRTRNRRRLAFQTSPAAVGGWGVVLVRAAHEAGKKAWREEGAIAGVTVACPRELIDQVASAAEDRGCEVLQRPGRRRLFGVEDRVETLELADPDGLRVTVADVDACAALQQCDGGEVVGAIRRAQREEDAEGVRAGRRGEGGLRARFLQSKERELGKIEAMLAADKASSGLQPAMAALRKLLDGVRSWVRGGAGSGGDGGEQTEVLVELCCGLAADVATHRKSTQESQRRRAELETERRAAERTQQAAREKLVAAEERSERAEEGRDVAEEELDGAKAELQEEFARVMQRLGAAEGSRHPRDPLGSATAKCDAAGAALARAKRAAEDAQELLQRAEEKMRAEEERGEQCAVEMARLEQEEELLAGEAEGLLRALAEAAARTRHLLQQMLGECAAQGPTGAPGPSSKGNAMLNQTAVGGAGLSPHRGSGGSRAGMRDAPAWAQALQEQMQGSVGALSRVVEGLAQETKEIKAHVGMLDGHVSGGLPVEGMGSPLEVEEALREAEDRYARVVEEQKQEREASARRLREAADKLREAEGRLGRLEAEVSVLRRRRGASVGLEEVKLRGQLETVEAELRAAKHNATAAEAKLEQVRDWVSERWPYMQAASPSSSPIPPLQNSSPARTPIPDGLRPPASAGFDSARGAASPRSAGWRLAQTAAGGAQSAGVGLEAAQRSRQNLEVLLAEAQERGRQQGVQWPASPGQRTAQSRVASPATPPEDEGAMEWNDGYGGSADDLLKIEDHTIGAAAVRLQASDDIFDPQLGAAALIARLETPKSPHGRVHFRAGQYLLGGPITIERPLGVTADDDAVVLGRWSLQAGGRGDFSGVKLINVAGGLRGPTGSDVTPPTLKAWMEPCILVWAGPWTIDHCELRSQGGVALRCFKEADMTLVDSGVGGLGVGENASSIAISLQEQARCEVIRCTIEKTIPTGGGGVRCRNSCVSRIVDTVIHMHAHGVSCSGSSVVEIQGCQFIDNQNAAICVMEDAEEAQLEVRGNTVWGDEFLVKSSEPRLLVVQDNQLLPPR